MAICVAYKTECNRGDLSAVETLHTTFNISRLPSLKESSASRYVPHPNGGLQTFNKKYPFFINSHIKSQFCTVKTIIGGNDTVPSSIIHL